MRHPLLRHRACRSPPQRSRNCRRALCHSDSRKPQKEKETPKTRQSLMLLLALASNLIAMASNPIAMASSLPAMASSLLAMPPTYSTSDGLCFCSNLFFILSDSRKPHGPCRFSCVERLKGVFVLYSTRPQQPSVPEIGFARFVSGPSWFRDRRRSQGSPQK